MASMHMAECPVMASLPASTSSFFSSLAIVCYIIFYYNIPIDSLDSIQFQGSQWLGGGIK